MNDLKSLTRVVLTGVTAFLLIPAAMTLLFIIPTLFSPSELKNYTYLAYSLPMVARFLLVCFLCFLLFFNTNRIVNYLVKEDAGINIEGWSLGRVYRLATVIMGGFFIYDATVGIASVLGKLIDYRFRYEINTEMGTYTTQILSMIILLALGIYLLTGAPHLVKWQVAKTLEQCKELEEKKTDTVQL